MKLKKLIICFLSAPILLFLGSGCSPSQKSKATEPPNIVWIVTEDMNPILGCYGDKLAKTPNIDKLAESGVVFQHAYANKYHHLVQNKPGTENSDLVSFVDFAPTVLNLALLKIFQSEKCKFTAVNSLNET